MHMTPAKINIAIAKTLGWKTSEEGIWFDQNKITRDKPDFYSDLNACAEMEDGLNLDGKLDYEIELDEVTGRDGTFIWSATAPKRCEAFLRVKGLWRDQP